MKIKCPRCSKEKEWLQTNTFRPFCSEQCKLIDFGAWANEEHVISENLGTDDSALERSEDNALLFRLNDS